MLDGTSINRLTVCPRSMQSCLLRSLAAPVWWILTFSWDRGGACGRVLTCFFPGQVDKTVLRRLGIPCSDVNDAGCRTVMTPTVFFMPHCPALMYSNVVLANWRTPEHVLIVGNG